MDNPDIVKMERFGFVGLDDDLECFCFACGVKIDFDENLFSFDRFGRIFCSDDCRFINETGGF